MKLDIVAIIEEQERLALAGGQLQQDRIDALDQYLGRPYGDEEEGRSSIVMRDIADTVEWIKPSLMKVFCSGDEVCVFNPVGPEDEPQAEQETDYCNHVLMQKNQGFLVLHDWFHDALLQKNGYVLVSYEEENETQKDRYDDLTDDEFALLAQNPDVKIVEHTENIPGQDEDLGQPYTTHDVVIERTREYGCIRIKNIPPERVLVAPDWPGVTLEGCPFVEVVDFPMISELRAAGYDVEDTISDLSSDEDVYATQNRRVTRDANNLPEDVQADSATRRVRTRYVWMQIDGDGDGKAELHRYVIVGKTILDDEEDSLIPVACCTPYRMPHEHNGMSVADIVGDIQRIRTALIRGFLDNMYQVNSPRHAVDLNMVNIDDMLTTRPGGIVRVNGPVNQAISPLLHPADGGSILQAVEYVDTVRENRSGVTKYNQGLDANSLNKTAHGMQQIMSASQQRIELVARIIAETGLRQLLLIIRAMSMKHSRQQELVKLRNQWVPVDPSSWRSKRDITVSVGIGTGNKDQMLQHLQMILMAQKESLPLGIATPKNIYNALTKLTQNAGFKIPDEFWTDPEENPMPAGGPPPEQIKAEADMQKTQLQLTADQQKFQAQSQLEQEKMAAELAFKAQKAEKDRQAELRKVEMQLATQMQLAQLNHDQQMQAKSVELAHQDQSAQADRQHQEQMTNRGEKQAALADNMGALLSQIETIAQALQKPMKLVRGPDGRTAEIH